MDYKKYKHGDRMIFNIDVSKMTEKEAIRMIKKMKQKFGRKK